MPGHGPKRRFATTSDALANGTIRGQPFSIRYDGLRVEVVDWLGGEDKQPGRPMNQVRFAYYLVVCLLFLPLLVANLSALITALRYLRQCLGKRKRMSN
jgi:hypothetical protein